MTRKLTGGDVAGSALNADAFRGLRGPHFVVGALLPAGFYGKGFIGDTRDKALIDITIQGDSGNCPPALAFQISDDLIRRLAGEDTGRYGLGVIVMLVQFDGAAFGGSLPLGVIVGNLSGIMLDSFPSCAVQVVIQAPLNFGIDGGHGETGHLGDAAVRSASVKQFLDLEAVNPGDSLFPSIHVLTP